MQKALEMAGLQVGGIDEVVLVGGSSRLPWILDWIGQHFGRPPYTALSADEGVAAGATIMAGIIRGSADVALNDVIPLSLGIKVAGDAVSTFMRG